MPRYIPPSIVDRGLRKHLELTKPQHNDYGYDELVDMISRGVNRANLARIYGVDVKTMKKWIDIYKQEQGQ